MQCKSSSVCHSHLLSESAVRPESRFFRSFPPTALYMLLCPGVISTVAILLATADAEMKERLWSTPAIGVPQGVGGGLFLKLPSRCPPLADHDGLSCTASEMSPSSLSLFS